jgi:hypothetical protein
VNVENCDLTEVLKPISSSESFSSLSHEILSFTGAVSLKDVRMDLYTRGNNYQRTFLRTLGYFFSPCEEFLKVLDLRRLSNRNIII